MPQLGETVAEGKITKWFKAAGDAVKPGDNLFEIETDKTSMEVPATSAGTLTDIRFQVGETAKVGAVVAVIAAAGEAVRPKAAAPANAPQPPLTAAKAGVQGPAVQTGKELDSPLRGNERAERASLAYPNMDPFREVRTPERNYGPAKTASGAYTTPLARRLAGERGIDLSLVSGSGPRGRIVAADVDKAASARRPVADGASAAQVKALFEGVAYQEVQLDGMRATIAKRVVEAKQTVPHFYLTSDLDVGRLVAMREEANAAAPKGKDGEPALKLSLNDFIVRALALA